MDINGLHEIVKNLREDFHDFRSNEFHSLEKRVDKISIKIAWIVGVISTLAVGINVLLKLLG